MNISSNFSAKSAALVAKPLNSDWGTAQTKVAEKAKDQAWWGSELVAKPLNSDWGSVQAVTAKAKDQAWWGSELVSKPLNSDSGIQAVTAKAKDQAWWGSELVSWPNNDIIDPPALYAGHSFLPKVIPHIDQFDFLKAAKAKDFSSNYHELMPDGTYTNELPSK